MAGLVDRRTSGALFLERATAGDVPGLVALYEPEAVLALPDGQLAVGHDEIGHAYQRLLGTGRRTFTADEQRPALVLGDLALTSTRIPTGATAEVARRQGDGTWLWILDRPNLLP